MDFKHFQTLVDNLFSYDDAGLVTRYQDVKPETLNPLVLAYIGDAYFNLYMRGRLLAFEQNKVQILHSFGAKMVSAKYQSVAYKEIEAELTELEQAVFKRGRNAKCNVPKSATVQEYRCSTGFEALLGFLYLKKDFARLTALVDKTFLITAQNLAKK